jgi:hypothetical protein
MAKFSKRANPYGITPVTGKGYSVARCYKLGSKSSRGERIHMITPAGHAACDDALIPDGRTSPRIQKGEFDCYRCIKIAYMENQASKKAFVERTFKPSEPSKRQKHLMLPGGRSGRYIGKRAPKDKSRLDKRHMATLGYMESDISDKYGPEHVEYFQRGPDYAPAQIDYIPLNRAKGMKQAAKKAAQYRKIANPAVSFVTKDGRKVSFSAKKNPAVSFRTKDGRSVSFTTKKNGKKSGGRR